MKRFSKHELFKLRNSISINMLISEILKLSSKTSQGQLRFLCPLCSQFNTATKRETNLARCFHCQRNFNTIEMVMETKNLDFIQSAQFLQGLLLENKSKEMTAYKPSSNPRFPCPASFQIEKEPVPLMCSGWQTNATCRSVWRCFAARGTVGDMDRYEPRITT